MRRQRVDGADSHLATGLHAIAIGIGIGIGISLLTKEVVAAYSIQHKACKTEGEGRSEKRAARARAEARSEKRRSEEARSEEEREYESFCHGSLNQVSD